MDWIRENKSLAVILGVIIAVSAALGYLLFDAWSSYTATKENYMAVTSQVIAMKSAPLAPTQANLDAKKALVAEFATTVNKLGTTLLILQPQVQPIKDIEFQAKLKTKVADVRKAAATFRMGLPAEFAFGFDEYTNNLPKSEVAATELSGYLDAVDDLVKLFMNSGVQVLDSLERSKLPVETAGAPQPQQRNARPGAAQAQTAAPGGVLEKSQVSVVLTLDQGALQLVTSRLTNPSEMPHFTSLRVVRIENQSQEGPPRAASPPPSPALEAPPSVPPAPAPASGAAGTTGAATAAPVSEDLPPPPPAPADSVPLIGQEKLKVRMEIDLVKFLDSARGVAAQSAPAPQR